MEVIRSEYRFEDEKGNIQKGNLDNLNQDNLLKDEDKNKISNLQDGELSEMVELKDGSKAKILKKDDVLEIYKQKDILVIPNELFGEKLSNDMKMNLQVGQIVPFKDVYLQIDKETNSIIVRGKNEIKIPSVIGENKQMGYEGYKLTSTDKMLLANNKSIDKKLLCGENGFFLADFKLTEDRKGISFSNMISITQEQAQDIIRSEKNQIQDVLKENKQEQKVEQKESIRKEDNAVNITDTVITESTMKDNNIIIDEKEKIEKKTSLDRNFIESFKADDWIELNKLAKNGYIPSEEVLKQVDYLKSEEKKIAVDKIFGIEDTKKKDKGKVSVQQEDQRTKSKSSSVKQAVNTMFGNM